MHDLWAYELRTGMDGEMIETSAIVGMALTIRKARQNSIEIEECTWELCKEEIMKRFRARGACLSCLQNNFKFDLPNDSFQFQSWCLLRDQ